MNYLDRIVEILDYFLLFKSIILLYRLLSGKPPRGYIVQKEKEKIEEEFLQLNPPRVKEISKLLDEAQYGFEPMLDIEQSPFLSINAVDPEVLRKIIESDKIKQEIASDLKDEELIKELDKFNFERAGGVMGNAPIYNPKSVTSYEPTHKKHIR